MTVKNTPAKLENLYISEPHMVSRKVLFYCATLLRKLKHLEIATGS